MLTFRLWCRSIPQGAIWLETLSGEAFILRFLKHVLPKGFTKIRYHGFLSTCNKKANLSKIRAALGAEAPEKVAKLTARGVLIKTTGVDPYLCSNCKTDRMRITEVIPTLRGSPEGNFTKPSPMKTD